MALVNLAPDVVQAELAGLEGWSLRSGKIAKTFEFESFADAVAFVNRVADIAEDYDHHPDIDVRYNKVHLASVTHQTEGITSRDIELARRVEAIG